MCTRPDGPVVDACSHSVTQFRELGRPACDRSELPVNHLAGTARLGQPSDRTAVVDLRLRVLGVRALRVADASVMPRPPSGNTHATCMMIGERAADFLHSDLQRRQRALRER
jgi:choline dehydrogenase-like flavoprotein